MRKVSIGGAAVLLALATLQPAQAQNAANGERLASQWCSNCHADANRGSDTVPTFQGIANRQGRDAEYLRNFLSNPHPPMPPFQIGRSDIEDLVAFIVSLRQR